MRAIEILEPGKVQLVERAEPTVGAREVLLQVHRIGYCGSDLAAFRGINPLVTYPRIPGHEIAATIAELGSEVESEWEVGQRVLVIPYSHCGNCAACLRDRPNTCVRNQTLGVQRDGALGERFVAPADKLIASSSLSMPELALVEPLSIGFHAVARGQVTEADTVGVIGCGAIGLGAIAGAAFAGARVVAIDITDGKLTKGLACGATAAINSSKQDLHSELQALTEGHGPDVMIEAVGLPSCYRTAVEEVAAAGRVVYIGWSKGPVEYDTTPFVFKELDIRGSRNAGRADFDRVLSMLEQGDFPLNEVITQTIRLEEAPQALRDWSAHPDQVTKIHIELCPAD